MPEITLLSQETIDKIAAGEVVERPSSVVKELVENAIDARATAVTVEIKEGGISLIRITDNGCGIAHKEVPTAFLRHSTSKIRSVEDLLCISSLGFRGEALSSIAAVAQVELITKTYNELTGTRYVIEGSKEKENEEIGAPDGTTFIVRNLFYNTPARRKFLKTAQTEGGYISDLMERLALSHPAVSFKLIQNGQTKLHTSGNSNQKDLIYHIYGRDITSSLLAVDAKNELFCVTGFIGKPVVSRGNRNYESYFINGRYVKSALLAKAIEDGYKGYLMQHQYPFCVLYFTINTELLDVNVHPAKMELRFSRNEEIYETLRSIISSALSHKELIPEVPLQEEKKKEEKRGGIVKTPEPFELRRRNELRKAVSADSPYEPKYPQRAPKIAASYTECPLNQKEDNMTKPEPENAALALFEKLSVEKGAEKKEDKTATEKPAVPDLKQQKQVRPTVQEAVSYGQQNLSETAPGFLSLEARKKHRVIGQLFNTYWLVEYEEKLFIIDQHAAHEKVLYEKTMTALTMKSFSSQTLCPPIILSLSSEEAEMLQKYKEQLQSFGYEVEPFGGKEYAITAIPADFSDIDMKTMFIELLDDFAALSVNTPSIIMEKVASMSCKAAVKGRNRLSRMEAEHLIDELLQLDNPYQCPHGRPTIIAMTRYELEKKFKRIV